MASDLTARVKRGGERRRKAPVTYSCGGVALEKTELGLPGADSNRIWVRGNLRDKGKPMEATAGNGRARG